MLEWHKKKIKDSTVNDLVVDVFDDLTDGLGPGKGPGLHSHIFTQKIIQQSHTTRSESLRRTNIQVENSAMNFLDAYKSITIQSEAYRDLFFNEWMFDLSEHADDG